ncbi:MAG: hypothetical protein JW943_00180 [Deltaproteobacteria bacterium]|nr:hypothetical protein [Deltaproteobacteria bacterium]
MPSNPRLKNAIFEVVDNQLRENNPPETTLAYERLLNEGHSKSEAKRLIGCVVAAEMYYVMKNKEAFNIKRFAAALDRLPEIPGNDAGE